jgi:hypothetical protein
MEFADFDGGGSREESDSTQRFSDDLLADQNQGLSSEDQTKAHVFCLIRK